MATMKGNQRLVSLYIEPGVHDSLKELSKETRIPVAAFLREAVDDLLAKHGKGRTAWYEDIAIFAKLAKNVANRYRSMTKEMLWVGKCEETKKRADEILAILGKDRG